MQDNLFKTVEGKLLLTGILLALALVAGIVFYFVTDFETAKTLVLVFIAHSIGGRAAGIGLCILQDFGTFSTIFYNFYLEILIVCFTYSIFVLSATQYLRVEWVIRIMENIAVKAYKNKQKIARFGWVGIFFFVMAPLPVTGPVVGSIIVCHGTLAGDRACGGIHHRLHAQAQPCEKFFRNFPGHVNRHHCLVSVL